MERGFLTLCMGAKRKCTVRCAVAVRSLLQHWAGPIAIVADQANLDYVFAISQAAPSVQVVEFVPEVFGRNTAYFNKTRLPELSPFEETVFFDADTLFTGDFGDFEVIPGEFTLTQFSDWTVPENRMISGRVQKWHDVLPGLVEQALGRRHYAVNTGIMGWTKETDAADWRRATKTGKGRFIADEIAMQILVGANRVPHRFYDDRFNCSPIYGANRNDVRCWHFHGRKHLKGAATDIWFPAYQAAVAESFAGIETWGPLGDDKLRDAFRDGILLGPAK